MKIFENQREADVSDTALATKRAECDKETLLAKVEAKNAVDIRDAELKTKLEKKNAETQTEKLRADLLSKATVDYEIKVILEFNSVLLCNIIKILMFCLN